MRHNLLVQFRILGPVEASSADGDVIDIGGPRPRSVLAQLLARPGRLVTTDRLIDEVYGDDPPAGAANALQSQISRLRRRLGVRIETQPAGYRLDVDPQDVDAHRFEQSARQGRELLAAGEHQRAARVLREALQLWRGPAQVQQARLEELRLAATEDRLEAELALGEAASLVPTLQQLVDAYPLRERLCGQLIQALFGSGRQAEALTVYERLRATLAEELGADPSPELRALHLELLRGRDEPAGPVPRAAPSQFTSFVGREAELRLLGELLGSARLVSVIGPGGMGKTRLAAEAATRFFGADAPSRTSGATEACFVELDALTDGAQIPAAILGSLGLRPSSGSGPTPEERLISALAERPVLLILDNCEHLVEDTALLVRRLLVKCPHVRVLATGREALGLTGEALCPLPPLEQPAAVRLFTDRAAAVAPGFAREDAPEGQSAAVARVCAALEGLPLALELAAARLRTLSVEDVAARLDDRFRLLSRGDRTAAPRHQTLRSVVEWSWDLLDEDERALAARLTIFSGRATLPAVEAVCELPDAEYLLDSLVGKSLVEARDGGYRMSETVRAFGAEQLANSGRRDHFRQAHAAHFLALAEAAEPAIRSTEQVRWLTRLADDQSNLQAALRRSVDADTTVALRLMAALTWYAWLRGLYSEFAPLARRLLESVGSEPPPGLAEEYTLCLINTQDEALLGRAGEVLTAIDRPLRRPILTVLWALNGGPGRAGHAAHLAHADEDAWSRAVSRLGNGFQEWFAGRPAEAEAEFTAVLAAFRAVGDRWGMANALDPLAMFAGWRGEHALALERLDEALDLVRELDAPEERVDLLRRRADTLLRRGDPEQAGVHYTRAAELARRIGVPDKVAAAHRGLGELARLAGDFAEARRRYEDALAFCADSWSSVAETQLVLTALGRTAEAEGRTAEARDRHHRALELALEQRMPAGLADAAEGLAGLAVLESDGGRAALLLGAGTGLRGSAVAGDPDTARIAATARELVGTDAYDAAHRQGRELSLDEALTVLGGLGQRTANER